MKNVTEIFVLFGQMSDVVHASSGLHATLTSPKCSKHGSDPDEVSEHEMLCCHMSPEEKSAYGFLKKIAEEQGIKKIVKKCVEKRYLRANIHNICVKKSF